MTCLKYLFLTIILGLISLNSFCADEKGDAPMAGDERGEPCVIETTEIYECTTHPGGEALAGMPRCQTTPCQLQEKIEKIGLPCRLTPAEEKYRSAFKCLNHSSKIFYGRAVRCPVVSECSLEKLEKATAFGKVLKLSCATHDYNGPYDESVHRSGICPKDKCVKQKLKYSTSRCTKHNNDDVKDGICWKRRYFLEEQRRQQKQEIYKPHVYDKMIFDGNMGQERWRSLEPTKAQAFRDNFKVPAAIQFEEIQSDDYFSKYRVRKIHVEKDALQQIAEQAEAGTTLVINKHVNFEEIFKPWEWVADKEDLDLRIINRRRIPSELNMLEKPCAMVPYDPSAAPSRYCEVHDPMRAHKLPIERRLNNLALVKRCPQDDECVFELEPNAFKCTIHKGISMKEGICPKREAFLKEQEEIRREAALELEKERRELALSRYAPVLYQDDENGWKLEKSTAADFDFSFKKATAIQLRHVAEEGLEGYYPKETHTGKQALEKIAVRAKDGTILVINKAARFENFFEFGRWKFLKNKDGEVEDVEGVRAIIKQSPRRRAP